MSKVTTLTNLASTLESETSAVKAHEYPPESLQEFPCFVLDWTRGVLGMATASDTTHETCTALAALYINRQVLPLASEVARPFIDEVRDALNADASMGGACFSIEQIRFEGPGAMDFTSRNGVTTWHYGIRFEIDFLYKENTTWAL